MTKNKVTSDIADAKHDENQFGSFAELHEKWMAENPDYCRSFEKQARSNRKSQKK